MREFASVIDIWFIRPRIPETTMIIIAMECDVENSNLISIDLSLLSSLAWLDLFETTYRRNGFFLSLSLYLEFSIFERSACAEIVSQRIFSTCLSSFQFPIKWSMKENPLKI